MKNFIICTITALALAGCIAQPSAASDGSTPEAPEVPAGAPETPAGTPEATETPAATPEATDAPVSEDEGVSEGVIVTDGSELSEAERAELEDIVEEVKGDSITEGLICVKVGWAEACRAPDLADMGLAPLPDGTPVTVVTEEQVQELKATKTKRPGVPKTGY